MRIDEGDRFLQEGCGKDLVLVSSRRKGGVRLPKKAMSVHEAEKIAQKISQEQGVELVDVELVKEPAGHFLRFYIDRPDGISLDELEAFHRRILPLVEDVAYDYMEVSSPGADRPLKTERDFERAQGMWVELKTYRPVNGGKQFQGELAGLVDGKIEIVLEGGEKLAFDRKAVAIVRPLIEFTEEDLADDAPEAPAAAAVIDGGAREEAQE